MKPCFPIAELPKHHPEGDIESKGFGWDGDVWKAALEWVKSRSDVAKSLYMIGVDELDDELQG